MSLIASWAFRRDQEPVCPSHLQAMTEHAPGLFAVSMFLGIVALHRGQIRRAILFILSTTSALLAFRFVQCIRPIELGGLAGLFILLWTIHMINLLFLDDHIPPEQARHLDTRLIRILFDYRGYARGLRNIRRRQKEQPEVLPWLCQRFVAIVCIVSTFALYILVIQEVLDTKQADFAPPKRTILRRIPEAASHEIMIRIWTVFDVFYSNWAILAVVQHTLASIRVLLECDEPDYFIAFHGRLTQTYTIRRFWTFFLAQIDRKGFCGAWTINIPPNRRIATRHRSGPSLRRIQHFPYLGRRTRNDHGAAWFQMWLYGGHHFLLFELCRYASRGTCAADHFSTCRKMAEWAGWQGSWVFMGIWILFLVAAKTTVPQNLLRYCWIKGQEWLFWSSSSLRSLKLLVSQLSERRDYLTEEFALGYSHGC